MGADLRETKKKGHAPFCRRTKRTTVTRLDVRDSPILIPRSLIYRRENCSRTHRTNLSTPRIRPPGVESPQRPPQPNQAVGQHTAATMGLRCTCTFIIPKSCVDGRTAVCACGDGTFFHVCDILVFCEQNEARVLHKKGAAAGYLLSGETKSWATLAARGAALLSYGVCTRNHQCFPAVDGNLCRYSIQG